MHIEYEDTFVKLASMIGGQDYLKVARALLNSEDVTDEEIASATGLRINVVRKILYDMFGKALISGVRVKDEKKGWFVYRWRARRDYAESFIENQKKKILERLKKRLEYEESCQFYHCGNETCSRLSFEEAVDVLFKCPQCKGSLNLIDNSSIKKALKMKIDEITKELKKNNTS